MTGWKAVAACGAFLVVSACLASGQYISTSGLPPGTRTGRLQSGLGDGPDLDPVNAEKRIRALNADRHKSMVSDTEKLLQMARQLDAEIASNPSDELTPAEVRKIAIIEKLAHNVKTKMAQSFGAGPEFKPPPIQMRGPGEE